MPTYDYFPSVASYHHRTDSPYQPQPSSLRSPSVITYFSPCSAAIAQNRGVSPSVFSNPRVSPGVLSPDSITSSSSSSSLAYSQEFTLGANYAHSRSSLLQECCSTMSDVYYEMDDISPKREPHSELSWSPRSPSRICTICGAPSNGFHFNAPSCSACAAFFRRTVTLDRKFSCAHENNCKVNYAMRVICRACRYAKCIMSGMDRKAVQPRRDCNIGRRKINYSKLPPISGNHSSASTHVVPSNIINTALQDATNIPSPELYCQQTQQMIEYDQQPISPSSTRSSITLNRDVLEDALREERMFNERRKILYCTEHSIASLLGEEINDIPFTPADLRELTFLEVQKDSRSMILIVFEWIRMWPHWSSLSIQDKKSLLCRCILYHCIVDPCYLTYRLGDPHRFVFFNGSCVGIDNDEGWGDEGGIITGELKKGLYRDLMLRALKEVVEPMATAKLSFTEFVALKTLVSWKSSSLTDFSPQAKEALQPYIDSVFAGLHAYYRGLGMEEGTIAERTGTIVLLLGNIFDIGLEIHENHQKILFFELWELDSLLRKLICRSW